MAASVLQKFNHSFYRLTRSRTSLQHVRTTYKLRYRGLPPERAKSWQEKKADIEKIPPEQDMAVNIGLPLEGNKKKLSKSDLRKMKREKNIEELERKARLRELIVPLEEVIEESFKEIGQKNIHLLAKHYGIFRDLYGDAYFYPALQLHVGYDIEGEPDMINPVFHGNKLLPAEASKAPDVHYKGDPDKLYTLCMTSPDSHLEDNYLEYMHWMITNIPGSDVDKGEVLCDYLPLFPVKGTGYHRYVFILYQQEKRLKIKSESFGTSLEDRSFNTLEFYRDLQQFITPVGLSFFQAEWDESVRDVFHKVLEMNEPRFEFLPPAPYIPKQKLWPIREAFNVYLDQYRDVKDIGEEVLCEKLKTADPFKPRPPPKKYPNVYTIPKDTPSWLRIKINEQKLRKSYWKDLDD